MNSTTSLPLPARTNDTASITQMSENIFTRPKGQEIMATEVTTTVQAWLNSSQPDLVEDDPAATPFEEGLEFDRLSIGSIPDEEGPIDSPDVGSAGSQHHHSADTSIDEDEQLVLVRYYGDSAIPVNIDHQRALLDSLIFWAANRVWHACKRSESHLHLILLMEVNNLHNQFHLNTEVTAEAMWLYNILRKSRIFSTNCEEAFSKANPLRVKLGDTVFCAFATYVISVYVALDRRGTTLSRDCAIPLALEPSLHEVVIELMDIAHELRNASKKSSPGVDICVRALTSVLGWMEARPEELKWHVHWILCVWYMKAALVHRTHATKAADDFFILGGQSIQRASSDEICFLEYKRLELDWVRFPSVVDESPMTARWVTKILERYVVCFPLDVEESLEWIHMNARMSLVTCCFAIWIFGRLWEGTHLRQALEEVYGTDFSDPEEEVVWVYCLAVRGATLVLDDAGYQIILRGILPGNTTLVQYERLQRAMLQDLDYRLYQVWCQPSEWLEVQWTRTTNPDESLITPDIEEAFKSLIDLIEGPSSPEEVVQQEAD